MFQVSTAGRFAATVSTAIVAALLFAASASGVVIAGSSVGQNGTGFTEPGSVTPGSLVNDLSGGSSSDVTSSNAAVSYVGITYGSTPTQFNHITVDMYAGYVISGFNVQIATAPNPSQSNDADWTTVKSYSGLTGSSGPGFNISLNETTAYGVRVVSTNKSNSPPNGYMRTNEIWVFNNYADLAPQATATGWVNSAAVNDETAADQAYQTLPYTASLNWATPQLLGAVMITGGAGSSTEHLINYTISANGVTLETVTGNTLKTNYFLLPAAVMTSDLTLHVTAADTDSYGRVGEIWAFEAPEPASMSLLAVGGLMLLKRRRA